MGEFKAGSLSYYSVTEPHTQSAKRVKNEENFFWLLSPLEAPKWVQNLGNGLKSIRGSWGDHLRSISGVFDPFRGLSKPPKPKMYISEAHSGPYFDLP